MAKNFEEFMRDIESLKKSINQNIKECDNLLAQDVNVNGFSKDLLAELKVKLEKAHAALMDN